LKRCCPWQHLFSVSDLPGSAPFHSISHRGFPAQRHGAERARPAAALWGGALLLAADAVSRSIGSGSALPVGAITSLLGAPFFLTLIFGKKEGGVC